MTVVILVLLTVQGLTGDTINLFAVFPSGTVGFSDTGFLQAVFNVGPTMVYHTMEGFLLVYLSIAVLVLSLRWYKTLSVRLSATLGLVSLVSAGIGGLLFVISGFQNNVNSAQMGGSFIGAYAFYFLLLYYTKQLFSMQGAIEGR